MGDPDEEPNIHPTEPPDPPNITICDFPVLNASKSNSRLKVSNSNKHFDQYLVLDLKNVDRRHINPYEIKTELEKISGQNIAELTGTSKCKLNVKTTSAGQTEKLLGTTSLLNKPCSITRHPSFNGNKGLIRVRLYDFQDMEELKSNISTSNQCNIEKIEKATFIKSRNGETSYIITFKQELPYSIYIPGEISDTVVQPFKSRPMMCRRCLQYGHTQKRCNAEKQLCRRCTAHDHEEQQYTAEFPKCLHCSEAHATGHRDCTKEKQEQTILDVVEKEKVTFQRARQIITETPISRTSAAQSNPAFHTLFTVTLPKGTKRSIDPWLLEKAIQNHTGKKPRNCRGKPGDDDSFIVEVQSKEESRRMSEPIIKIGMHVAKVQLNNSFNIQKGLIFIQGYDLLDFESYKKSLIEQQKLVTLEHAHWMNLKDKRTQALIVGFQGDLPSYLNIPGETKSTLVHEYKRLPLLCKKCLEYGHSKNVCREKSTKCQNCTSSNHQSASCEEATRCLHCTLPHKTGEKSCQRHIVEEEVLAIQSRSRVSRSQAFIIYEREHPNARSTNYAAAVISLPKHPKTSSMQRELAASNPEEPKHQSKLQNEISAKNKTKEKTDIKPNKSLSKEKTTKSFSPVIHFDENDGSVTITPNVHLPAGQTTQREKEKRSRVSDEGVDRGRSRYREEKRIKSDRRTNHSRPDRKPNSKERFSSTHRSTSRSGSGRSNHSIKHRSPGTKNYTSKNK